MTVRLSEEKKNKCLHGRVSFFFNTEKEWLWGKGVTPLSSRRCTCLLRRPYLQLSVLEDGQRTKEGLRSAKNKGEMKQRVS